MYSDLQTIAPEQYMKTITKRLTDLHAVSVSTFVKYIQLNDMRQHFMPLNECFIRLMKYF